MSENQLRRTVERRSGHFRMRELTATIQLAAIVAENTQTFNNLNMAETESF